MDLTSLSQPHLQQNIPVPTSSFCLTEIENKLHSTYQYLRQHNSFSLRWPYFLSILNLEKNPPLFSSFLTEKELPDSIQKNFKIEGNAQIQWGKKELHISSIAKQNLSLRFPFPNQSSTHSYLVHFLVSCPSNIEENLYLILEGPHCQESLRIGNSSITLCETTCQIPVSTKELHLYSFSVSPEFIHFYIDGKIQRRKRRKAKGSFSLFSFCLLGHPSADLGVLLYGLQIHLLSQEFLGFEKSPQNEILPLIQKALKEKDLLQLHENITSFDGLLEKLSKKEKTLILQLIEANLFSGPIREWIYQDFINEIGIDLKYDWEKTIQNKLPHCAIEVKNLTVDFFRNPHERFSLPRVLTRQKAETFSVLKNIDFRVFPGDVLGVLGANGAGKSSLLKAIAGLIPIRSGEITVRGNHLLLSPGLGIRDELSGKENIFLACCFMGLSLSAAQELYEEIVDFSELRSSIDQPFKFYSDGMKSRLIFSIATSLSPEILMLDELLNAGDLKFQKKAAKRMDELIQKSKVVIVVTHSISFIAEKCTKALLISQGEQIAYGDPKKVISHYLNLLHLPSTFSTNSSSSQNETALQELTKEIFLP